MKMRFVLTSLISVGFSVSGAFSPAVPQTMRDNHGGTATMNAGPTSPHHSGGDAAGQASDSEEPARTIVVEMVETDGRMAFVPDLLQVEPGEHVRFRIRNKGELEHEFVLGSQAGLEAHRATMEQHPDMAHGAHDEPGARRLAPGEAADLGWAFAGPGRFEFVCLIPGHLEAGMKGTIMVDSK